MSTSAAPARVSQGCAIVEPAERNDQVSRSTGVAADDGRGRIGHRVRQPHALPIGMRAERDKVDRLTASLLESTGALLAVLTPLVAVPLTVITFYLRSLREHQVTWHAELVRRIETVEATLGAVRKTLAEFERDYTTKEEWLRECMATRQALQQWTEATLRVETIMNTVLAKPDRACRSGRVPSPDQEVYSASAKEVCGSRKDDA